MCIESFLFRTSAEKLENDIGKKREKYKVTSGNKENMKARKEEMLKRRNLNNYCVKGKKGKEK